MKNFLFCTVLPPGASKILKSNPVLKSQIAAAMQSGGRLVVDVLRRVWEESSGYSSSTSSQASTPIINGK